MQACATRLQSFQDYDPHEHVVNRLAILGLLVLSFCVLTSHTPPHDFLPIV